MGEVQEPDPELFWKIVFWLEIAAILVVLYSN
jgi:hypothetical protein